MRRLHFLIACACALAVFGRKCGAQPDSVASAHGSRADTAAFSVGVYAVSNGARLSFRLLAPAVTAAGHRYPLVLQLHGSGAIGTNNAAQLGPFAARWANSANRARFAAYILVPQFPSRTVEYRAGEGTDGAPVSRPLPPLELALELLDSLRRVLPIDTTRVYVVGFSMGGSAVWHSVLARPTHFASAISFAGVPPAPADLRRFPEVPFLLVHGTSDTENPFTATQGAYETLLRTRRRDIEFRTYPGLGHEMPADVSAGDWWREWLFQYHR